MSALKPAHSSWIAFHGYSNGTMTLITKSGESYAAKIPESRYADFLKSPSQGSFFSLYIKPFAKVTKVDVTEDVALVEKAKDRIAMDAKFAKTLASLDAALATPSTVAVPSKARKAPAKTKLPHKPYVNNSMDSAWLDFRCLADPTTDVRLANTLRSYLAGKDRAAKQHLPIGFYDRDGIFSFISAYGKSNGRVAAKYVKGLVGNPAFSEEPNSPRQQLADSYRAAYRSWVRREAAKKAKVKAASGLVKGEAYAWVSPAKAIEAAAKEVFADGWGTTPTPESAPMPSNPVVQVGITVPVGVDQKRVDKALAVMGKLESGEFHIFVKKQSNKVGVYYDDHNNYASFTQKRL